MWFAGGVAALLTVLPDRPGRASGPIGEGDAAARLRFEHALAIREEILSPRHPLTAQSLAGLAALALYEGAVAGDRERRAQQMAADDSAQAFPVKPVYVMAARESVRSRASLSEHDRQVNTEGRRPV